jgi:hypothetical protein
MAAAPRAKATGKLTIAAHKVPMKYGQALRLALDFAIIPMIDPSVSNLPDYLKTLVNCQAVGQYVFEAIDLGAPSTFEAACNAGIVAAANTLYTQLDNLDSSALEFGITGTARAVDRNRDGKMDDIQTGVKVAVRLATDPDRNAWVQRALGFANAHRGAAALIAQQVLKLAK